MLSSPSLGALTQHTEIETEIEVPKMVSRLEPQCQILASEPVCGQQAVRDVPQAATGL